MSSDGFVTVSSTAFLSSTSPSLNALFGNPFTVEFCQPTQHSAAHAIARGIAKFDSECLMLGEIDSPL
jgi:hypothetical protein